MSVACAYCSKRATTVVVGTRLLLLCLGCAATVKR
jgi:hypothetical protein